MVKANKFIWTPQNGRTVKLSGHLNNVHQKEEDGEIVELYDDNGLITKVGGTIYPLPKSPFKVNTIKPVVTSSKIVGYNMYNSLLTSSSTFVLPFLGVNRKWFLWDSLFINCFIGTTPEDTGKVIALLYRFSGKPVFLKFEAAMCAFRNFVKRYDPDPYHVMFVFDVPTSAAASYEHYVNGRYSEIDGIWKLKIMDFHGFDSNGRTGKILFQDEGLRKELEKTLDVDLPPGAELHSAPDLKYEVFNSNYYLPSPNVLAKK
jgi:hypothetical protein